MSLASKYNVGLSCMYIILLIIAVKLIPNHKIFNSLLHSNLSPTAYCSEVFVKARSHSSTTNNEIFNSR